MAVYRAPGGKMYRIQFRLNNRTYVKSAKTTDKRVAERMEAEWKAEIHGQQYLGERQLRSSIQTSSSVSALQLAAAE